MIQTIVVGVDGTEGSRRALEWTAQRATELHANVIAVFAMPPASEFVMSIPPLPAEAVHDLRSHFEQHWCQPLRDAGVAYRSYVVEESAAHALVRLAQREHADLVVLGAHGHGSFTDRLLGSVSYTVSHAAPCPVVIIPAEARAA
jgi:nucleotide-binding universal stress UspA family protein